MFQDPSKLYSLLTECFNHGRLNMAYAIILSAKIKQRDDRELVLDQQDSTGAIYDSVYKNISTIEAMNNLDKVLLQILGNDSNQNYIDRFSAVLYRAQKLAELPNASDTAMQNYEFLLKNGAVIFPNNIKIKNRYVNALVKSGKWEEAKEFIKDSIDVFDYNSLSEPDKIAYMKLRSKFVKVEKHLQSQSKKPKYYLARRIAEDSLVMNPSDFDAQLHLSHISLLERNYSEADRRIMSLSKDVELDKYGDKYHKIEKEGVKSLRQSIMRARLEEFGIEGVVRQEDEKQHINLEGSLFDKELLEIQRNVYEGDLNKAKSIIDKLPQNAINDPIVLFVKMQYYLVANNPQSVKNIFNFCRSNNSFNAQNSALQENIEGGMRRLVELTNRISESQEEIEYTL